MLPDNQINAAILQRLYSKYSRDLIPASKAGEEIKEGMTATAVRIAISRATFPLPTAKVLGVQTVRLVDLAAFLTNPSFLFGKSEPKSNLSIPQIEKRGRGQRGPGKRRLLLLGQGTSAGSEK